MSYRDVLQVCINGHQITNSYNQKPQKRKKFCGTCGAETIIACTKCNAPIPGKDNTDEFAFMDITRTPEHCEQCGDAFPWQKASDDLTSVVSGGDVKNKFILIENICSRFHLVVKQLKSRYNNRDTLIVEDEYDTQDLLHSLLHIHFEDIRPEEWTPSYAGGCSRVDFLLKQEKIIIEVKKTRETLKAKDIGEQLIIDTVKYRSHPDCNKLFCFVYDPEGWVSNPQGIENDLNSTEEEFEVKVLIVPKGH